jgi:hypothetical protein
VEDAFDVGPGWSRISRPAPALSGAAYTRSIAFAPAIHPPISNRSATASYISGASRTQIGEPEKHEDGSVPGVVGVPVHASGFYRSAGRWRTPCRVFVGELADKGRATEPEHS